MHFNGKFTGCLTCLNIMDSTLKEVLKQAPLCLSIGIQLEQ